MAEIKITNDAYIDLQWFRKHDRVKVLDSIKNQLTTQPATETTNRKILRSNSLATWELRVGVFRVFYNLEDDSKTVIIVAIGQKKGQILYIRGEEFLI